MGFDAEESGLAVTVGLAGVPFTRLVTSEDGAVGGGPLRRGDMMTSVS